MPTERELSEEQIVAEIIDALKAALRSEFATVAEHLCTALLIIKRNRGEQ